jgi:copper chaperone NosL
MKKHVRLALCLAWMGIVLSFQTVVALAAPVEEPGLGDRCPVCGMSVAKYSGWFTQLSHGDGTVRWFDGVKDLLAYYFQPEQFGSPAEALIQEVWVKDYSTQAWIAGRQAYYVTGSDVRGPMGDEFVPFSTLEAAEVFLKNHGGDKIWSFGEITPDKVEELRASHKMKKKGQHGSDHRTGEHHGSSSSSSK